MQAKTDLKQQQKCINIFKSDRYKVPVDDANGQNIRIHLKGFASHLNFKHKHTESMATLLIDFICGKLTINYSTVHLIWDGDSYSDESFTSLIPRLYNVLCKSCKIFLVAFVQDVDKYGTKKEFLETWSKLSLPISLYLTENFGEYGGVDDDPFALLGQHALKQSRAKHIVCFGGGKCLKKEYELGKPHKKYTWFVFPATRYHSKKKTWESATLAVHFANESDVKIME